MRHISTLRQIDIIYINGYMESFDYRFFTTAIFDIIII